MTVFDNDPNGSAAVLVRALASGYPFRLTLHPVPAPGLCAVRNAILSYAAERFDLVAMIDDDEVPAPGWLAALLHALETHAADAAVGPVPQILPASAPRWLRAGNFFAIPTFADGAAMADGYTGKKLPHPYGVDRDLSAALRRAAQLLRRRGSALLSPARASRRPHRVRGRGDRGRTRPRTPRDAALSLQARVSRRQQRAAFCDRCVYGTPAKPALRAAKGLGLTAIGASTLLPRAAARPHRYCPFALYAVARGARMLGALAGFMIAPYARPVSLQEVH